MDCIDTSSGIRAKKARQAILLSGKDKVKKRPLIEAG